MLLGLLVRSLATAAAVALAGRLAARGGPLAAALAMAVPLNAGPGFLLVILEGHDGAFVARGALAAIAGAGGVLLFATLYTRLVPRVGLARGFAAAVLGWLALALPIAVLPATLPVALVLIGVGALVARRLWDRDRNRDVGVPPAPATWAFLFLRGLVLGTTVTIVARVAGDIGPVAAGLAFAFPLTITTTAVVLELAYGRALSVAAVAAVPRTLWVYVIFCAVLWALAERIGPLAAWWLGIGAAVLATLAMALLFLRERTPA